MVYTPQTPFYIQNLHAALHVLKLLDLATNLISITPEADPKSAPHVEDFVIQHDSGYDYYQIKTSSAENFTTGDLMGIWRQLAIGWKKIRGRSTFTAQIYILTNRPFGNQSSRDAKGQRRPALTQIVEHLINPCKEAIASGSVFRPPADLSDFWQLLREESGLGDLFDIFISHLNFCPPDLRSIEELREALTTKLISFVALPHEAKKLTEILISAVSEWSAVREKVTPLKLKERLDISGRGILIHEHTLTDLIPREYTPFGNIQEQLEENIGNMQKGIIFLRGVPGSGKTVAITKFIDSMNNICLRYYAYNPKEHSDRTDRVKQKDFYHDLLIQLAKRFPDRRIPHYIDPHQDHRKLFWEKIKEIGDDIFQHTQLIIIIDGLDHAARAKALSVQTFLDGLKGPDELPDNVILILSGQPSWEGYPIWLEDKDIIRIIDVPAMSTEEINAYLNNTGLWLSDLSLRAQLSYILREHTEGNPLSVRYAAQAIKECNNLESVKEILAKGMLPGKDLQLYYGRLWEDISKLSSFQGNRALLQNAQAIFVVSQEPITPDLLEALNISPPNAMPILETLNPVLSTKDKGKIIYHNDFRLFLESKLDISEIRYVNHKLADYYMKHPYTKGNHAYMVKHYWEAEKPQQVLEIVTQQRYDDKIKKNRLDNEITSELELAFVCALTGDDPREILQTGLMLIRNGIRVNHWENCEKKEHFFFAGHEVGSTDPLSEIPPYPSELALERRTTVLRQIPRLMKEGREPLAHKLWGLWSIDPVAFLNVESPYGQRSIPHDPFPYLQEWIKCALIFNKNRVIELNEYFQGKVKEGQEDWEKTNIAKGFSDYTKTSIWKALSFESALLFKDETAQRGWTWNLSDILWGAEYFIYRNKKEEAAKLIDEATPLAEKEGGYLAARTAWFCIRFNRIREAETLSKSMALPLSPDYLRSSIRRLVHDGSERDVYRYFAVKAYFNISSPLSSFRVDLSEFDDTDAQFTSDPLMRLCPLMALIGRLERNISLVPQYEIEETLKPILTNHQGNLKELSEDLTGHCLYELSDSDRKRGLALAEWISELYRQGKVFNYKIMPFISWLYDHGQARLLESIAEKLTNKENLGDRLPTDRAEQFLDAGLIWNILGDTAKAKFLFSEARLGSEGLGYEDYQLSDLADTILRIIKHNRNVGILMARRFVHYAMLAGNETDGSGGRHAIEILVPSVFIESSEEGEALCMEISEGMRAVSLEDGILLNIAKEFLNIYNEGNKKEYCALLALLFVSPKPTSKHDDEFLLYRKIIRLLEHSPKQTGLLRKAIEYLNIGILEPDMSAREDKEVFPKVGIREVKEWLANARSSELFHPNYSTLQKKMFAALKEQLPTEGWRIYKDACLYYLQNSKKSVSHLAVRGMLSFFLDLIPDEYLEKVSNSLDEHMQISLRYSLHNNPVPTAKLTTAESGLFFEATSKIIMHLLSSRYGRTLSEAGRALSVLSEADADFVINLLVDHLGTKDQFSDVRILEILNGLMFNCPLNFEPHLPKLRDFFENCNDLRRKSLILNIFRHLRDILVSEINQITLDVGGTTVFIEPAGIIETTGADNTNKEIFIHKVNDQVASFSRRLSNVTRKIISKEEWYSYIKAYITPANSKRNFSFAKSHSLYSHPAATENDIGLTASEVAWKLMQANRIPLRLAGYLNQALTELDPILLISIPNGVPEYIPPKMEDYAGLPYPLYGPEGWSVLGLSRMQGKETSYISVRICSGFFPKEFYKELSDVDIAKVLHRCVGTFGWTLADANRDAWHDVSALQNNDPYIPLVVPSGGLITFPPLMADIALWNAFFKSEGLSPDQLKPTTWRKGDKEILSFTSWDNGTEYESPRKGENTDYGFLWLAKNEWLAEIQKKYHRNFIQLVEIASGNRKYRDKPFGWPDRNWHAFFPVIAYKNRDGSL